MEGTINAITNYLYLTAKIPYSPGTVQVTQQPQDSFRNTESAEAILVDQPKDRTTIKAETVATENEQISQSEIERDEQGKITKGIAQDTNKNKTAGRPCKFCENKEDYLTKANAYLERCKKGINGKPIIPYIEELAMALDTIDENITNWANKKDKESYEREHPEFFTIYAKVKMLQKLRLKQRALGRYNPAGALALLRFDHGAIETSKQIQAGAINEPVEIRIIEEKPIPN